MQRHYTSFENSTKVPHLPDVPPFQEGKWKFVEGNPVTREVHDAIADMISQMNKGIATLKDLTPSK
jgi:hypothetical protein